ncbi:MAG TPA: hypothetical protein VLG16_05280 [Candidatus Saccharimonadales bacterium]|nr:hypothetical protein [Candidatus Saccharimonadales bacterium]
MEKKRIKINSLPVWGSEPYKALLAASGILFLNAEIRDQGWLADVPNWANPSAHIPNACDTVGLIAAGVAIASNCLRRTQKESHTNTTRYAAGIMLAGIAANAAVELPETQPVARIFFRHSTPDPVDFIYGAATSVALFPRSRRWIETVANDSLPKAEPDLAYTPVGYVDRLPRVDKFGPSSLELASRLYDFSSETARPAQQLGNEVQK